MDFDETSVIQIFYSVGVRITITTELFKSFSKWVSMPYKEEASYQISLWSVKSILRNHCKDIKITCLLRSGSQTRMNLSKQFLCERLQPLWKLIFTSFEDDEHQISSQYFQWFWINLCKT